MNFAERQIFSDLQKNPGMLYIAPDRKRAYVLVDGGMLELTADFSGMSEEDVNAKVQELLS